METITINLTEKDLFLVQIALNDFLENANSANKQKDIKEAIDKIGSQIIHHYTYIDN
jgi:hypothetical protein